METIYYKGCDIIRVKLRDDRQKTRIYTFKEMWLREQLSRIRKVYTPEEISNDEIATYLLGQYEKRRLVDGRFYNNVTRRNEVMNAEQFIDYFMNSDDIFTGYGTIFKSHDTVNLAAVSLKIILDNRAVNKKKMVQSPHGSDEYVYYKTAQNTFKILANSYYGILGQPNSVFYNPHIQNSVTTTGQDIITMSISAMESFLSNNEKFKDMEDVYTFIESTLHNKYADLNILDYVDRSRDENEVVDKILDQSIFEVPNTEIERITKIVGALNEEERTLLYFRNNFTEIMDEKWFINRVSELLGQELGDDISPENKEKLEEFTYVSLGLCFTEDSLEDRFARGKLDRRKNIIVVDTDSNFISLNQYIEQIERNLNLEHNEKTSTDVINILVHTVTEALRRLYDLNVHNMGVHKKFRPIINMKSEFNYKKVLTTRNKKNYAGIIVGELGKTLPKPKLDMKGLAIKKSTVAKMLRDKFEVILFEDILSADNINISEVIERFDDIEEIVDESIRKGEVSYLLPKSVKGFESYAAPDSQEVVRAVIAWNALEPTKSISPPDQIYTIKLIDSEIDSEEMLELKAKHPDKYKRILSDIFNIDSTNKLDVSRFKFNSVAIPKSEEKIPDYILPFIDYRTMIEKNVNNGYILLESLGILVDEYKDVKYKSNIIEI